MHKYHWLTVCISILTLLPISGMRPPQSKNNIVGNGTPGSCTEAAFDTALANGGEISFNCGPAPHTIAFSGQKSINSDTVLDGGGLITLDGLGLHRLFDVGAFLTLRNIVLARGYFNGDGGAIRNTSNGVLLIMNSTIRDSHATYSGGAILSGGVMTITNSILEGNTALNGGALYPRFAGARTTIVGSEMHGNQATDLTNGWGGALLAWDGAPVRIESSIIHNNTARSGGGLFNYANSTLEISNSEVLDNDAYTGGGIYNDGLATLVMTSTILIGNTAGTAGGGIQNYGSATLQGAIVVDNASNANGGGIRNGGTLFLNDSLLAGNNSGYLGGGLQNDSLAILTDSTVSDNTASQFGGGLSNDGEAQMNGVTFSGNTAGGFGGGMYNSGILELVNSTVSGNSAYDGGGIGNDTAASLINVTMSGNSAGHFGGAIFGQSGEVAVMNSIVANSPSGGNCVGDVRDDGFNLSGENNCGLPEVSDVMLGPLADNGGPTLTHIPLPGSPAIDAGDDATCPASDQRGETRPLDGDVDGMPHCDIGAVEMGKRVFLPMLRR